MTALSDEELIEQFLNSRDYKLFSLIYKRYYDKVYGKCLSLLADQMNAQDAAQDIFIKVLLNLSKFTGRSKFSTWLYSIANNFCIDILRKRKKTQLVSSKGNIVDYDVVDDSDDILYHEARIGRLSAVLLEIMPADKTVLTMKYQEGLSIRDISQILQKTESAVKMQIKRAKHRFRLKHQTLFPSSEVA